MCIFNGIFPKKNFSFRGTSSPDPDPAGDNVPRPFHCAPRQTPRSETFPPYPSRNRGPTTKGRGGEGEATVVKNLALNKRMRGLDLPYCLNCTNLGKLILRKIIKIAATRCHILFKAKMHPIRFRLGLCPRLRWGSLQRSPRPPSWI